MEKLIVDEFHTYKVDCFGTNSITSQKEFSLFQKIFNKQIELNNLTYPAWKEKLNSVDWQSAVLVEAGELLESFGYKWWKKQERDIENVKVELIDILHFLLSDLAYYHKNVAIKAFDKFYNEGFMEDKFDIKNDYMFKDYLLTLIYFRRDIIEQFFYLAKLFKYVGMDFDEVYRAYFVKNILNEFRQKNGYKQGSYIKIWKVDLGDGIKKYEDNQVAYHLVKQIPLEKLDKELMNRLEKKYKEK